MKIGCCVNMNACDPKGIGIHGLEAAARAGCDYIELPLAQIMALTGDEFAAAKKQIADSGIPCEACNNFVPGTVRLTGPDANPGQIRKYTVRAIDRARELGAEVIVFGSSQAKNIPKGFEPEKAWKQIKEFLHMADEVLDGSGMIIVVEPLCRLESNLINTVSEGLQMVQEVNRRHIRLLVDFYHTAKENEEIKEAVSCAGKQLYHAHIAVPEGRAYPHMGDEAVLQPFFEALADAGYSRRVSLEGYSEVFGIEIGEAVDVIRRCVRQTRKNA